MNGPETRLQACMLLVVLAGVAVVVHAGELLQRLMRGGRSAKRRTQQRPPD